MAGVAELMSVVGTATDSEAVRTLIARDGLVGSTEPDLEEGEPVRSALTGHAAGYELLCQEGRVVSAFLFVEPDARHREFSPFAGLLPGGLAPSDTRTTVRRRFDAPERSSEAFTSQFLGRQGAWDRFAAGPLRLHFQYEEPDERIGRVTIMLAELAP